MVTPYLLEKRRSALPSPREKGGTAMGTFLLSSVKSREVGHGLCHHLLEKRGTALLVLQEGEGDDHGHLLPYLSRELWR